MATNTYVALNKVTVSGTSTNTITFNSISSTYTDLVVVASAGATATGCGISYQVNGDTSSIYSVTALRGNGATASSFRQTGNNQVVVSNVSEPPTTGAGTYIINFQNYSNTNTYKTSISRGNAAAAGVDTFVGLWRSTAAITSITLLISGGNYNSGSTFSLYGIAAQPTPTAKATGGTIVYGADGYTYHTFTSTGTFTPLSSLTADILVVAGGAGGGGTVGGGGGAGGLLGFTNQSLSATGYTCTVGAGGTGSTTNTNFGGNGVNSQFGALTAAIGGGGGVGIDGGTGSTGGSGGGGSGLGGTPGNGTSGQGYGGGTGGGQLGAGGGGAGAIGGSYAQYGAGGVGSSAYSSWGAATFAGQNVNGTYYFAGGGGGGTNSQAGGNANTVLNVGGYGGGGRGGTDNGPGVATGTANTGGAGGGGRGNGSYAGASGGSGIIIVRYVS